MVKKAICLLLLLSGTAFAQGRVAPAEKAILDFWYLQKITNSIDGGFLVTNSVDTTRITDGSLLIIDLNALTTNTIIQISLTNALTACLRIDGGNTMAADLNVGGNDLTNAADVNLTGRIRDTSGTLPIDIGSSTMVTIGPTVMASATNITIGGFTVPYFANPPAASNSPGLHGMIAITNSYFFVYNEVTDFWLRAPITNAWEW